MFGTEGRRLFLGVAQENFSGDVVGEGGRLFSWGWEVVGLLVSRLHWLFEEVRVRIVV